MDTSILLNLAIFILGIMGVYFGAHFLVTGSSSLAISYGVRPIIVGMTLVAFATSLPEFVVSITAQLKKSQAIAVGNIIGSNIANIALVLGLSALVRPVKIDKKVFNFDLPLVLLVSLLFYMMALNLEIGRIDGIILLAFMCVFLFLYFRRMRDKAEKEAIKETEVGISRKRWKNILESAAGLALLVVGAHFMIRSAVQIAVYLGVSEMVIGITIVAVGTSIPELATSVVAAAKKQSDISIGNVLGSNIFNIALVIGVASVIMPITITRQSILIDIPIMIMFAFLLIPMILRGWRLGRISGILLLLGYALYITYLFV